MARRYAPQPSVNARLEQENQMLRQQLQQLAMQQQREVVPEEQYNNDTSNDDYGGNFKPAFGTVFGDGKGKFRSAAQNLFGLR